MDADKLGFEETAQAAAGPCRRFSAAPTLATVQRPLRGESPELISDELGMPALPLTQWRNRALLGTKSALTDQERDARDAEIARLQAKVGEIMTANEVLHAKTDALEGGHPFGRRRLKPTAKHALVAASWTSATADTNKPSLVCGAAITCVPPLMRH